MYELPDIQRAWSYINGKKEQYKKDGMMWSVLDHEIALWALNKQMPLPQNQEGLCPDCGMQNPIRQNFCGECGRKLKNM